MDNFTNSPQDEQQKYLNMMPNYEPQVDPNEYRIGFGRRLGAGILDILFHVIILMICFVAFGIMQDITAINWNEALANPKIMQEITENLTKSITPLSVIIAFLYYSMEVLFSATPGKMLLGLIIANQNRTRANTASLARRFAIKNVSYFFTAIFALTWIQMFSSLSGWGTIFMIVAFFFTLSASRQSLYDKWSKTAVFFKDELIENHNEQSV